MCVWKKPSGVIKIIYTFNLCAKPIVREWAKRTSSAISIIGAPRCVRHIVASCPFWEMISPTGFFFVGVVLHLMWMSDYFLNGMRILYILLFADFGTYSLVRLFAHILGSNICFGIKWILIKQFALNPRGLLIARRRDLFGKNERRIQCKYYLNTTLKTTSSNQKSINPARRTILYFTQIKIQLIYFYFLDNIYFCIQMLGKAIQ